MEAEASLLKGLVGSVHDPFERLLFWERAPCMVDWRTMNPDGRGQLPI
jgi:hypothetical protein